MKTYVIITLIAGIMTYNMAAKMQVRQAQQTAQMQSAIDAIVRGK